MEFLKDVFNDPKGFKAFEEAVTAKGFNLADLSAGGYVDVNKFNKVDKELKSLKETRDSLESTINGIDLDGKNAEITGLKAKLKELEEKENQTKQEIEKAKKESEQAQRFSSVAKDDTGKPYRWSNSLVEEALLNKFKKHIELEENKTKGDKEILSELISGQSGLFASDVALNVAGANGLPSETVKTIPKFI